MPSQMILKISLIIFSAESGAKLAKIGANKLQNNEQRSEKPCKMLFKHICCQVLFVYPSFFLCKKILGFYFTSLLSAELLLKLVPTFSSADSDLKDFCGAHSVVCIKFCWAGLWVAETVGHVGQGPPRSFLGGLATPILNVEFCLT